MTDQRELEALAQSAAESCPVIDWPTVIEDIDRAGLCMFALARALKTSEQSIRAIRSGRTYEPRYQLAQQILAAHAVVCRHDVPHGTV